MRMAGRFSRRVRGYAKANSIPIIDCGSDDKKHQIAEEHLQKNASVRDVFPIELRLPAFGSALTVGESDQMDVAILQPDDIARLLWPDVEDSRQIISGSASRMLFHLHQNLARLRSARSFISAHLFCISRGDSPTADATLSIACYCRRVC
jgi:hypothetical protein